MKSKDGFVQAYNAQAAVDAEAQIIVAQDVTQCAVDCAQLVPMTDAIETNLGRKPDQLSADAGYCARRPISRLRTATSMPTWRPAGPGMLSPAPSKARQPPQRRSVPARAHRRALKRCAPRSRPAVTKAPTGCASNFASRCSGKSNRPGLPPVPSAWLRESARRVCTVHNLLRLAHRQSLSAALPTPA